MSISSFDFEKKCFLKKGWFQTITSSQVVRFICVCWRAFRGWVMESGRALMGKIRQSLTGGGDEDGEEDLLGESGGSCSLSPLQVYIFGSGDD